MSSQHLWKRPNDPDYPKQWGLQMVHAENAWSIEKGRSEIIVAVIEGAFDLDHPDLAGQLLDPYDATEESPNAQHRKQTTIAHGTHVSGIIAAKANNGVGIAGLAPGCRVLPIQCTSHDDAVLARAIRYAVAAGARVINMSSACYFNPVVRDGVRPEHSVWKRMHTPPTTEELLDATHEADDAGLMIASCVANNENYNSILWPAAGDVILGVTAVNHAGAKSNFSCYGDAVDVAAPGGERSVPYRDDPNDERGIYSTIHNGGYRYWSGTCQSVPFVSALAALIFSRHPQFTPRQARQIICNTASGDGWNQYTGHGIIDAAKALQYDEPVPDIVVHAQDIHIVRKNATYHDSGATVQVEVTLHNQGPIDADKVLVALYDGVPDDGGYTRGYHYASVRGLESTVVDFSIDLIEGEHTICVLVDPFGQLPAAKRSRGEIYAKAQRTYMVT